MKVVVAGFTTDFIVGFLDFEDSARNDSKQERSGWNDNKEMLIALVGMTTRRRARLWLEQQHGDWSPVELAYEER